MHKSTNSGTTWTQISQWLSGCGALPVVHADIHAITFKPGVSTEFIAGTDGGVYRTTTSGTAFTQRNNSYNVTQFYGVAVHPTAGSNYFLAGAQDNGTQRFNAAGVNATLQVTGGDGGFAHIDQNNVNTQITSFTGNNYSVSTNAGATFTSVGINVAGEFINPTDFDNVANVLYCGVATGGQYLRWVNPGAPFSAFLNTIADFGGQRISTVQVGSVANRVYFGFLDGRVVRVDNANSAAPTSKILRPAGGGAVSCVALDPRNAAEDHLLVTYSNFGVTSVFETLNANAAAVPTWTAVEGNLPDMPVRWAIFDPRNWVFGVPTT
jgi:trimeric autotransporter adhesin